MKRSALFGFPTLFALLTACAGSRQPKAALGAGAPPPSIVTLRLRDSFVDIESGTSGVTYSILDLEGTTLASGLTREELKSKFRGHFEALERALAAKNTLDARVETFERSVPRTRTADMPTESGGQLHGEKDH